MHNRPRLLMGATALLYAGPLLAGLGGFGWATVPVFTAIFFLWLVVIRPRNWPHRLADLRRPEAWLTLAAATAVQALLVVICFGLGRGIGGVAGTLPPFALLLPLAVSFLAIPLARLIWDPAKGVPMETVLDVAPEPLADPFPPVAPAIDDGVGEGPALSPKDADGAGSTGRAVGTKH